MKKYVLSFAAERDLEAIWDYIAQDNLDAADRWIAKLFATFEALATNPSLGHKREDLTALPILFWSMGAYLILYSAGVGEVEIVAVAQGARDVPSLLRSRTP